MLILREYREADIPLLVDYLNDLRVRQYLTSAIPDPYKETDAEFWVKKGSNEHIIRAIEFNGQYVGDIGAFPGRLERSRTADVGYWIAQPFWGKGIATQALAQLTQHIFKETDIIRLQALVFDGNIASCRVLEKCGYIQEAFLKCAVFKEDQPISTYLYSCLNIP